MKTIHYVLIAAAVGGGLILVGRKLAPSPATPPPKSPLGQVVDGVKGLAGFFKGAIGEPSGAKASGGPDHAAPAGVGLDETPKSAYSIAPGAGGQDSRGFRRTYGKVAPSSFLSRAQKVVAGATDDPFTTPAPTMAGRN